MSKFIIRSIQMVFIRGIIPTKGLASTQDCGFLNDFTPALAMLSLIADLADLALGGGQLERGKG